MGYVTNYFVELHPGEGLASIILGKKGELIDFLGDEIVDDPAQSRFLRDDPHFTLMCARTGDMDSFRASLRALGGKFERVNYEITGAEDILTPGKLVEVRTVVREQDRQNFKDLHLAVMEASRHFNTAGVYERFRTGFSGEAQENIDFCGFPGARGLYKPHASPGRVHKEIRPSIDHIVGRASFDPQGKYRSGNLIVWGLPFESEEDLIRYAPKDKIDLTATPRHTETIKLRD